MTKPKHVAIYTRVSTDGQSVENQRRELLAVAEHLDDCFDCRDFAAEVVDPGREVIPSSRQPRTPRRR